MTTEELIAYAKQHAQQEASPPRTIAAADVHVDDLVYNGARSLSPWIRVVSVHHEAGDQVCSQLPLPKGRGL
jgi:hypothetical protein